MGMKKIKEKISARPPQTKRSALIICQRLENINRREMAKKWQGLSPLPNALSAKVVLRAAEQAHIVVSGDILI
jgi:hypothetical protein